ncbi:MAG: ComEA family DNA-binding protein [Bacillota bacterium]|nr:MAG: competence protein ComEA [Bacillota bacterium]
MAEEWSGGKKMAWQPWQRWLAGAAIVLVGLAALALGYQRQRWEPVEAGATVLAAGLSGPAQTLGAAAPAESGTGPGSAGGAAGPGLAANKAASGTGPEAGEIVVHVSGAVAAPGVYRLAPGARVHDAVAAARPLPEAVPDALNLAAALQDGEKVYVPRAADLEGAGGPPPAALGAHHGPGGGSGSGPGSSTGRINLNRATAEDLMTLPGIGPELARRILEHRQATGGFRRVEDLLAVPGIGPSRLAEIRDRVEVR